MRRRHLDLKYSFCSLDCREDVASLRANVQLCKALIGKLRSQAAKQKQLVHDHSSEVRALRAKLGDSKGGSKKKNTHEPSTPAPAAEPPSPSKRESALRDKLKACRAQLADNDSLQNALQRDVKTRDAELAKKGNEAQALQEQLAAHAAKLARKDGRITALENEAKARQSEVAKKGSDAKATAINDAKHAQVQLELVSTKQKALDLGTAAAAQDTLIAQLRKEAAATAEQLAALASAVEQHREELASKDAAEARVMSLQAEVNAHASSMEDLDAKVSSKTASILWHMLDLSFRYATLCGGGWTRILA